jgi:predicted NUDIX family NTP pyrophosphohydrolase
MPKRSAGCLVVRRGEAGLEVLLVHAKGATFKRPLFGIPKGEIEAGEDAETAAVRETLEETGLHVVVERDLGTVRQKSGKIVQAFLARIAAGDESCVDEKGRCQNPDGENDVCRFYPIEAARPLMIEAQRELLDRLDAI